MPASSSGRKGSTTTNGSATLLRASVLVALLAVGLPSGWRWWQQHSSLNDGHAVLEVKSEWQFERRYRLGSAFDLAWVNGSISVWPAGAEAAAAAAAGDTKGALWYVCMSIGRLVLTYETRTHSTDCLLLYFI